MRRLCTRAGGSELRAHPFFAHLDFDVLARGAVRPPIRPCEHLTNKPPYYIANFDAKSLITPSKSTRGALFSSKFRSFPRHKEQDRFSSLLTEKERLSSLSLSLSCGRVENARTKNRSAKSRRPRRTFFLLKATFWEGGDVRRPTRLSRTKPFFSSFLGSPCYPSRTPKAASSRASPKRRPSGTTGITSDHHELESRCSLLSRED